ncbi:MsnO8 family LLM class oxidoreductase [Agrobacterium tumefaciens]|uniref:MsnO8 family LLM class oxidoreductase n=1 Tax=Agrobacterium tumefaciens TaxID=358 RepID=UPI001572A60A|nr:MsnO8 family LLM class oxidoreductase [Agrobacterium tumefaciens]NTB97187.1 MsnO8 family LLM class oxidoreductase [Agrobacterium tumefaciens]NTC46846.1 MsnO8 family LLM class oxidoreductase [Agrobacterium tumefaciens]
MTFGLSFLDKSPIDQDESATAALRRTVALAQKAEAHGFRRFWVAEHHNSPKLASSSPEVLIGFLLAQTQRINIGSGGVMLQHYSAYKVAENFKLLSALAPGRVDLGVGKAPGGLPLSTRALQGAYDPVRKPSFEQQLGDLDRFVSDGKADIADEGRLAAYPLPPSPPNRFLLGASPESGRLAGRLGWSFVYAGHIHGNEAAISEALGAFRASGGKQAVLAVAVVVAETDQAAEALAVEGRRFRVEVEGGQGVNVGSEAQALEYVRQAGATQYRIEERSPLILRGSPSTVRAELLRLHQHYGIDEFIVECPVSEGEHRLKTIEYLAAGSRSLAA